MHRTALLAFRCCALAAELLRFVEEPQVVASSLTLAKDPVAPSGALLFVHLTLKLQFHGA